MELRVLQYFMAVAREQSISAAAESLHLSQPTLSTQLKALEEELGKQLLIRGSKGSRKVTLTEEGMLLRKRAEEILELVKKTENEIAAEEETIVGEVCIGAGETQNVRLFARAAKKLRERYPHIRYHIRSGNAEFVLEHLEKGLIDFGLLYGAADPQKYDFLPLPAADRWGVLMRRDAPLAQKETIAPQDLWEEPLILSGEQQGNQDTLRWLGRDLSRLHIAATYNLLYNASLLVSEGVGYALCFEGLVNTDGESDLCFRPLSPPMASAACIVWKKYQVFPRAARAFLACLRETVQEGR